MRGDPRNAPAAALLTDCAVGIDVEARAWFGARVLVSLIFSGDVLHSRYFESLYVTSRTAVYGTLGIEAEL